MASFSRLIYLMNPTLHYLSEHVISMISLAFMLKYLTPRFEPSP